MSTYRYIKCWTCGEGWPGGDNSWFTPFPFTLSSPSLSPPSLTFHERGCFYNNVYFSHYFPFSLSDSHFLTIPGISSTQYTSYSLTSHSHPSLYIHIYIYICISMYYMNVYSWTAATFHFSFSLTRMKASQRGLLLQLTFNGADRKTYACQGPNPDSQFAFFSRCSSTFSWFSTFSTFIYRYFSIFLHLVYFILFYFLYHYLTHPYVKSSSKDISFCISSL